MTDEDDSPLRLSNFLFSVEANRPVGEDVLRMTLQSEAYGREVEKDVRLRTFLAAYPTAVGQYFDFQLKWRECAPLAYTAPEIADIEIRIGDDAKTIEYGGFDQSPCSFQQSYSAFMVENRRLLSTG